MTVEHISWSISTKECCRTGGDRTRDLLIASDRASDWATDAAKCDILFIDSVVGLNFIILFKEIKSWHFMWVLCTWNSADFLKKWKKKKKKKKKKKTNKKTQKQTKKQTTKKKKKKKNKKKQNVVSYKFDSALYALYAPVICIRSQPSPFAPHPTSDPREIAGTTSLLPAQPW